MDFEEGGRFGLALGKDHGFQIWQSEPFLEECGEMFAAGVDAFGNEKDFVAAFLVKLDEFASDPFGHTVFVEFVVHLCPKFPKLALVFIGLEVPLADRNAGGNDVVSVMFRTPLETGATEENHEQ
jgi:hypothetical protein